MKKFSVIAMGMLGMGLLFSQAASADWTLNNDSSVLNFVSIKKNTIGEAHRFNQLAGTISQNGAFKATINLASVNTNIPVRDERMKSMLFDVASFPQADISGNTVNTFKAPAAGEAKIEAVKLQLVINGKTIPLETRLRVVGLGKQGLLVSTIEPLLLDAAALGYTEGIDKLREIAQLPSISTVVPVTFSLVFDHAH
ncbi:YceI family protein [Methylobacillus methanolivorans]|uniref:YceI family protein n=1 Tax=Methylobacillus methanolivorans TaxID=1848927 RepID=A0ABW8GID6_9PROT